MTKIHHIIYFIYIHIYIYILHINLSIDTTTLSTELCTQEMPFIYLVHVPTYLHDQPPIQYLCRTYIYVYVCVC